MAEEQDAVKPVVTIGGQPVMLEVSQVAGPRENGHLAALTVAIEPAAEPAQHAFTERPNRTGANRKAGLFALLALALALVIVLKARQRMPHLSQ